MPFQIIRNDITQVRADAIVNTANPQPIIGGGTDWAIHDAAGPELLEARKQIGPIGTGESAATPGFRLPAKYVLHTVSPSWIDGNHQEEELLRKAYDAALELADQLKCRSVAFPLMAAGTYAFPHDLAISVAIRAFTDFLLEHEMKIYLVLFSAKAFDMAGSLFDDLKSYIDDNYVGRRIEEEYRIDQERRQNVSFRKDRREEELRRRRRWERENAAYEAQEEEAVYAPYPNMAAGRETKASAVPLEESSLEETSLEEILKQREKTFSEYLLDLLNERDGKDSEVYKRAEVSRQLFSKIVSNRDYQPTKNTVIQLALGLELDVAGTQKLLARAGYALTRSSKTDLVVRYYIERKVYSIPFINEALADCGLPLLKTGLKT